MLISYRSRFLDPVSGVGGAQIGVREALAGDFNSLRRRLNVSPASIFSTIGKTSGQVTGNPELILQALQKFADVYVGDDAFQAQKNLFSNAGKKLRDAIESGFATIGDKSGLYDAVTLRIRGVTDLINQYVSSSEFEGQADRVGTSIVHILDNIINSVLGLAGKTTGNETALGSIKSIGDSIAQLTEYLAGLSDQLPILLPAIGQAVHDFIGALIDAYRDLKSFKDHPVTAIGNAAFKDIGGVGAVYTASALAPGTLKALDLVLRISGLGGLPQSQGQTPGVQPATQPITPDYATNLVSILGAQSKYQRQVQLATQQFGNPQSALQSILGQVTNAQQTGELGLYDTEFGRLSKNAANLPAFIRKQLGENPDTGLGAQSYLSLLEDAKTSLQLSQHALQDARPDLLKTYTTYGAKFTNESDNDFRLRMGKAVDSYIDQITKGYSNRLEGVEKFPDSIAASLNELALKLSTSLKDISPNTAARVAKTLADGGAAWADEVAKAMKMSPAEQAQLRQSIVKNLPRELQDRLSQNVYDEQVRNIDFGAKYGSADIFPIRGRGQQQLQQLLSRGPLSDYDHAQQLYGASQGRIAGLSNDLVSRINGGAPVEDVERTAAALKEEQTNLENLRRQIDPTFKAFVEFAARSREALDSGLGEGISNLIKGTGTPRDAFVKMSNDIVDAWSQMTAKMLTQSLIGNLGQTQQSGVVGTGQGGILGEILKGFGFGGGAQPVTAAQGASIDAGFAEYYGAANGGVFPGHFMPIHAFADGGVVSRPTFGLVGERADHLPEAVVPLPNGRGIPVDMRGGGGDSHTLNQRVFVYSDPAAIVRMGFDPNTDLFINATAADMRKGGKISKVAKRGR